MKIGTSHFTHWLQVLSAEYDLDTHVAHYLEVRLRTWCWIMQERKIDHTLLYSVCEKIVFGVKLPQRKNWVRELNMERCTSATELMTELYTIVRENLIEDLCVEHSVCKNTTFTCDTSFPRPA